MNKLMTVAALAVLLAACAKKEAEAPAAETAPAPAAEAAAAPAAAEPAPVAADAAAPAASNLPQACEDYLARAKACFEKSGGNASAAAFQQGVDQARAQWESLSDKSGLEVACKTANDSFSQTAAMLKCE
ncbi:DUF5339 domain-containing protein [Pseudoxanthomonas jiangsuensis]|uniref:DUF5339 domain-containing protein n=1 Tax=Pseudoxanthomonas jiangsuensis TaxID=619688 RepID=UPI001391FFB6|nr:DUF5339 domain-containing protein [Pseudoxanthomonas jiangsuensis]